MPPGNDNVADVLLIADCGTGASSAITIDDATTESGELAFLPNDWTQTVWWKFVADASGTATLSTEGSLAGDADSGDGEPVGSFGHLDTIMAVYSSSSGNPDFDDFTQIDLNDDNPGTGFWSLLSVSVVEGTTYFVQVGTFAEGYTGTVVLDWDLPCAPFVFPVHDYGDIGDCPAYVFYSHRGSWGVPFLEGVEGVSHLPAYETGDLLVLIWSVNADGVALSNDDPSWTLLFDHTVSGGEDPPQTVTAGDVAVWYKIAESDNGGVDGPTITPFEDGNPSDPHFGGGGFVLVFRCVSTATNAKVPFADPPMAASAPAQYTDGHLVLYATPPPTETVTLDAPALDVGHVGNHWWGHLQHLMGGEVYLAAAGDDVPANMYEMPPADPIVSFSDGIPVQDPGGSPNLHNGSQWHLTGTNTPYDVNPGPERAQSFDPDSITIGNSTHTYNAHPTDPESPTYHVVYPWEVTTLAVVAPEARLSDHNDFASALPITGCRIHLIDCNNGATNEGGEPDHAGRTGGRSVWYRWQAVASGDTTIDLSGSNFDTLLGVYTGSSVGSLTTIASDDDSGFAETSMLTFSAVAGTVYYIAVDGFGGDFGQIDLVLEGACQTMVAYWGINATPVLT